MPRRSRLTLDDRLFCADIALSQRYSADYHSAPLHIGAMARILVASGMKAFAIDATAFIARYEEKAGGSVLDMAHEMSVGLRVDREVI